MKKRQFLWVGLGAIGALTVGWGVMPPRQRLVAKGVGLPLKEGQIALNAWLTLGTDGSVTLAMPKSEMGQGIHTALAMIVAEELDVPLSAVRVQQSPIDTLYGNVLGLAEGIPFRPDDNGALARSARWTMQKVMRELGIMMTGGSSSVKDLWLPLREASAMTRASLVNSLATHWSVAADTITVVNGQLSSGDKRMALGDVVKTLGNKIQPASQYQLKAMERFTLLGSPTPRLDVEGKVNGSAAFGMDASHAEGKKPDFYAAVKMNPLRGGGVASTDFKAAKLMDGVMRLVRIEPHLKAGGGTGGVAVVAKSYWQAKRAVEAVTVKWESDTEDAAVGVDNASVALALRTALDKENGFTYYQTGSPDTALAGAAKTLTAHYSAPYLAHATMEPMNATINLFGKGKERTATIWVGTQVPDLARRAAAKVLDLDESQVHVRVPFLGGGFGRRLEVDIVLQAAAVAASMFERELPGTLQLIWSREDDLQHDFYRPAAAAHFQAGLDQDGHITSWINKAASQHIVPQYMPRNAGLPLMGPDKTSIEGAFDQAYEFANARVSHVAVKLPVPVGFWRSVGHSYQTFFKESFLDECAQAALPAASALLPMDRFHQSVTYRRALLKNHPRHLAVIELAVAKSKPSALALKNGWKTALGLALHESFGTIVAMVAEVSVSPSMEIRVHRITTAVDCGFCVNPAGVAQQVESSVAFGLSAALWGKIDFKNGQVQQSNFHDYRVLRMNEMPEVETHIVPSLHPPEGMGEPAVPPVAPAVANALFALTGQRLRDLPLALV